ncbi:hypothetical protein LZK76_32205 (plasmid) [Rhizobium leguminosarum]|nr:hypothetical protein LZK76_32205 [Rhizobium leguminosarum]
MVTNPVAKAIRTTRRLSDSAEASGQSNAVPNRLSIMAIGVAPDVPPKRLGVIMSPAASAKTVKTPTASPGVVKGKMTLKNASIGRAPRSRAASINRLSINSAEIQMASTMKGRLL